MAQKVNLDGAWELIMAREEADFYLAQVPWKWKNRRLEFEISSALR